MKYFYQVFIGTDCFEAQEALSKKDAFAQIEEKLGKPIAFRKGAFNKRPIITNAQGKATGFRVNAPTNWVAEFTEYQHSTGRWWEIKFLGGAE